MTDVTWRALLQAAGMAEAPGERIDLGSLAEELSISAETLQFEVGQLQAMGLVSLVEEDEPPRLRHAGRQWLTAQGEWSRDALHFLPVYFDDLYARQALITAGTVLVDEFRHRLLEGTGVEYAREQLVPPAFAEAINETIALNLFAAAVALMVRLSDDRPAGCVAEEIIAVALLEQAEAELGTRADEGDISQAEAEHARGELRGLFGLFEDDDVLNMFEMAEPADAAVEGHHPIKRAAGVVDQRLEAWFRPFGGVTLTGYLDESADALGA